VFLHTIAERMALALRQCTCGAAPDALSEYDQWCVEEKTRDYEIFLPGRQIWVKIKQGTCIETPDGYLQVVRRDGRRKGMQTYSPTFWRRKKS
jgi:hypothetical protein